MEESLANISAQPWRSSLIFPWIYYWNLDKMTPLSLVPVAQWPLVVLQQKKLKNDQLQPKKDFPNRASLQERRQTFLQPISPKPTWKKQTKKKQNVITLFNIHRGKKRTKIYLRINISACPTFKHTSLSWKGLERMVRLPSSIESWKREGMCSSCSFS